MKRDTILIVEDSEEMRSLLEEYLEHLGYIPITAANGKLALDEIHDAPPDLIIMDITMPEMDGDEVLKILKSDDLLKCIPVIIISAWDETDMVIQCIELGAEDYLLKPFNIVILKARVGSCLKKKHLQEKEKEQYLALEASYEALAKAEAARDALNRMVVHDLSSPLAVIRGHATLVQEKVSGTDVVNPSYVIDSLNKVQDSVERMWKLIQGILDVAKFDSGEMPVCLSYIDAVSVAKQVCTQLQSVAETGKRELCFRSDCDCVRIRADKELLPRVFENLVSNALKFGTARVDFSIREEHDHVVFDIWNDGPGIPKEYQERIFEKYFQIKDRTGRQKRYGVGLGLPFCKLAVEAQKGTIRAEIKLGEGAHFLVRFNRTPVNN